MQGPYPLPKFIDFLGDYLKDLRTLGSTFNTQAKLGEYLGLTHSTISRYENDGNENIPDVGYIAFLLKLRVEELVSEGSKLEEIQKTTLEQFNLVISKYYFREKKFHEWEQLSQMAIGYVQKNKKPAKVFHNLPQPIYSNFVGREKDLSQIKHILRPYPYSQEHLVTIDGIGGIGKSALALAVAYYYIHHYYELSPEERFDAIIWASAKQNLLTAEGIRSRTQTIHTLDDIYHVIAVALQREEITRVRPQDRDHVVNSTLSRQRTLLIIDNFESIDDEKVITFLQELIAPTKAIVTTRHRIDAAYPVRLSSMTWEEAQTLIVQEGNRKNTNLSIERSHLLYQRTHGVPLAIVWSVGQIGFGLNVETTLHQLEQPSSDIARFCFEESITRIRNTPAHKLLISLSLFAKDADRAALSYVANLDKNVIECDENLVILEKLSLVNRQKGRFELPPLAKGYMLSEIDSNLEFVKAAANRLKQYFLYKLSELLGTEHYWDSYIHWLNYDFLDSDLLTILQLFEQVVRDQEWQAVVKIYNGINHYLSRKSLWELRLRLAPQAIAAAEKINNNLIKAWYHIDALAWIYLQQGELQLAQDHIQKGEEVAKNQGYIDVMAQAACHHSQILSIQGNSRASRVVLEPFLTKRLDLIVQRHVLTFWAEQRFVEGDLTEAEEKLELAKSLCPVINDTAGLSYVLVVLANLHMSQGRYESAQNMFQEILAFEMKLDRSGVIARVKWGLAQIAYQQKDSKHAASLAEEAVDRFERVGIKQEVIEAKEFVLKRVR